MAQYRHSLPMLDSSLFITNCGTETHLIFSEGVNLPLFASYEVFKHPQGEAILHRFYLTHAQIAVRQQVGIILYLPTWRASADWGMKLGYTDTELQYVNTRAVDMLQQIRREVGSEAQIVIGAFLGPRGDAYSRTSSMTAEEAEAYHSSQINTLAASTADLLVASTMNNATEAIGMARAAQKANMPLAVSFTLETDGRLPSGQALGAAIMEVDSATSCYPSYYQINCSHPSHFKSVITCGEPWVQRLYGVQVNASRKSHAELNESTELDSEDPMLLAAEVAELKRLLPHLTVLGGCCGTDYAHIEAIAKACRPLFS